MEEVSHSDIKFTALNTWSLVISMCGYQIHISIRSIKIISSEIQNTAILLNNKNTRTDSGYTSHCQWTGDTPMKSKNLNSKVHLTPRANLGEI